MCGAGDASFDGSLGNYCGVTNASFSTQTDDDAIVAAGLARLAAANASGKPWFVSIGLHRTHRPWRLPMGWWGPQLFPTPVRPPKHPLPPRGSPWMAGNWPEGLDYAPEAGCPNCTVPAPQAAELRRWYYAATSYADQLLGTVLERVREMGQEQRTLTVFHSDRIPRSGARTPD